MKTAQQSATKFVERAGAAAGDYGDGAAQTSKDQSANAIAAKENYKQALTASFTRDAYAKGLANSGKGGWLKGVKEKGVNRFAEGVAAGAQKYATNSGKYDTARASADSIPRGPKGSEINFNRSKVVGQNLRKQKIGA